MMENTNIEFASLSDKNLLERIGSFIRETRLQQNKTQQQIADAAGINRSTLIQVESGGGGTLLSLIEILRALDQLHLFESFEAKQQLSPLELAKLQQQKRQRARNKNEDNDQQKSDW